MCLQTDYGRVINIGVTGATDLVLVAFSEQQCIDTLRYGFESVGPVPTSLEKLCDASTGTQSHYGEEVTCII